MTLELTVRSSGNEVVATTAHRVHTARHQAGFTMRELARATGLSTTTITNIESGRVKWPLYHTLRQIAVACSVSVSYLRGLRMDGPDTFPLLRNPDPLADCPRPEPAASAPPAVLGRVFGPHFDGEAITAIYRDGLAHIPVDTLVKWICDELAGDRPSWKHIRNNGDGWRVCNLCGHTTRWTREGPYSTPERRAAEEAVWPHSPSCIISMAREILWRNQALFPLG